MLKARTLTECNYRAIYFNGKTLRIALDPSRDIDTLTYPEFYDVKVTSQCQGACPYCYQSSESHAPNVTGITNKFRQFFSQFSKNQMPFQIAFGGGEPTQHPEFIELIKTCSEMEMVPNYTTNGMWKDEEALMECTTRYCGGVAVSCHEHLEKHWRHAVNSLLAANVHTNLHIIIGNEQSVETFARLYKEFSGRVKYFVLLPLSAQGRSRDSFGDAGWKRLSEVVDGSPGDVAFGANFHPWLVANPGRFNVSLYDPEGMSAYLDLETMKIWKSSFSNEERRIGK